MLCLGLPRRENGSDLEVLVVFCVLHGFCNKSTDG